jgi:hypothetical protein
MPKKSENPQIIIVKGPYDLGKPVTIIWKVVCGSHLFSTLESRRHHASFHIPTDVVLETGSQKVGAAAERTLGKCSLDLESVGVRVLSHTKRTEVRIIGNDILEN